MIRKILVCAVAVFCLASPAMAQEKVEISGFLGWVVSDGVPITATPINGVTYTRVDPKDSASFGFTFGVNVTPQTQVEFLFSRQLSKMEVRGNGNTLSGDMTVDNYHGNFVYNFGESDAKGRPFVFAGLGMTSYGEVMGAKNTIPGQSKFSWDIGGGIKFFPSQRIGFKGMVRWTPTYIKTTGTGWWCDPWFGCYPTGIAYYANQFEFSGGVVARF
jgi:hypothetical protein